MKKTYVPGSETAVWTYESVWGGGLSVTVIETAGEGAISVEAEPMGAAAEYMNAVDCMDMRISAGWC